MIIYYTLSVSFQGYRNFASSAILDLEQTVMSTTAHTVERSSDGW